MNSTDCASSNYYHEALQKMKDGGARITKARQFVVDTLDHNSHPLSALEILELAKEKKISIDLASVYRILHYLEELSLIHQIGPNAKFVKCIHNSCSGHVHVLTSCTSCHETEEVTFPRGIQNSLTQYLSENTDLRLKTKSINIEGTCSLCQKNS